MADLAEFYSANLAAEVLKGSTHKARTGGAPGRAPVGYVNVRHVIDGREARTVEIDEERASFVQRFFGLYAAGEYSFNSLHDLLTSQRLRVRPSPRAAEWPPMALSKFAPMLRNAYYLGVVKYRGMEYRSKHEPLISPELFARVQRVLDERGEHALKPRRHQHYLRGLLTCARYGPRLFTPRTRRTWRRIRLLRVPWTACRKWLRLALHSRIRA
jgi:site-specific DNA recombinase